MKVLVIGSGGREHALCWKIRQSPLVKELYAAPGNPGMQSVAELIPCALDDVQGFCNIAQDKNIDLVVVGPELPLSLGVVDKLRELKIPVCGPMAAAAQMEASKAFAKEIMEEAGVPTARSGTFTEKAAALEYLTKNSAPIVLKADGLAAGKGVFVCMSDAQVRSAIEELFSVYGARVVIEEFLPGKEASFICLCKGEEILPLAPSHDYKRIFDGHEGPNTGGMGTVSPTSHLSEEQAQWALEHVMRPTLKTLNKRGIPYTGFLYAGLMISESGNIHVLEFNARLGDPETQVIMRRMESDFVPALLWAAGVKSEMPDLIWKNETALCVVLASRGYPQSSSSGDVISGISQAQAHDDCVVFHAGTGLSGDAELVTAGGRVLNVTSLGKDVPEARKKVYNSLAEIQFSGVQYRKDIGW